MVIDYNEPEGEGVHLSELSILAEFRLSDDRIAWASVAGAAIPDDTIIQVCGQDGTLLYEEQIDGVCPFGEYKYVTVKRAGVSIKEEIEKVWKNVTTLSVPFMAYACTPDDYYALRGAVTNYIPTFSKSFPLQASGLAMNLVLQSYTTRSQLLRRKSPMDAMKTIEAGSDVVAAVLQPKDDQWTVIRAAIGMGSYLEAQDKLIEKLK